MKSIKWCVALMLLGLAAGQGAWADPGGHHGGHRGHAEIGEFRDVRERQIGVALGQPHPFGATDRVKRRG